MKKTDISHVVETICTDKEIFLADLKERIKCLVSSKKQKECVEIISTSPNGITRKWEVSDVPEFYQRFWAFIWNKPFQESGITYQLDSGLTAPIIKEVTNAYEKLIIKHQSAIVDYVILEILTKEKIRDVMVDEVCKKHSMAKIAGAKARHVVGELLVSSLSDRFHETGSQISTEMAANIGSLLSNTVVMKTMAISTKIIAGGAGKVIITKLSLLITKSLAPALAKLMAKPAVIAIMKKYVLVGIAAAFAKLIAAKFGLSVGATVSIIVWPVIIGWIIYDYNRFPEKLGKELGEAITREMGGGFEEQIPEIFDGLIAEFTTKTVLQSFVSSILEDQKIVDDLSIALSAV